MNKLLEGRSFQLWEYKVSHGSLLIRSPKKGEQKYNVDIKFFGVEYLAAPRHLKEITITDAVEEEMQSLGDILGSPPDQNKVYVLESHKNRHLIVAAGLKVEANELDIFDSPFN